VKIKKDASGPDFGKPYGVELVASSRQDREIIKRFWKGGVKVNSVTNGDQRIEFTFADLIGKPFLGDNLGKMGFRLSGMWEKHWGLCLCG
jgi:hypothetical protein